MPLFLMDPNGTGLAIRPPTRDEMPSVSLRLSVYDGAGVVVEEVELDEFVCDKTTADSGYYKAALSSSEGGTWSALTDGITVESGEAIPIGEPASTQRVKLLTDDNRAAVAAFYPKFSTEQISYDLTGYVAESAAALVSDDMLAAAASGTRPAYLTKSAASASRDPACWAADYDFSAVSIGNTRGWNNTGAFTTVRCATLVTARHAVTVKHFDFEVGDTLWFYDEAAGVVRPRTVQAKWVSDVFDLTMLLLSSNLPIAPMELLSDYTTWLTRRDEIYYQSIPGVGMFNNSKEAGLVLLRRNYYGEESITSNVGTFAARRSQEFAGKSFGSLWDGMPFLNDLESVVHDVDYGDSGSPLMVDVGGSLKLVTMMTTTVNGPALWSMESTLNAMIAALDAEARISATGYTVTVSADPS